MDLKNRGRRMKTRFRLRSHPSFCPFDFSPRDQRPPTSAYQKLVRVPNGQQNGDGPPVTNKSAGVNAEEATHRGQPSIQAVNPSPPSQFPLKNLSWPSKHATQRKLQRGTSKRGPGPPPDWRMGGWDGRPIRRAERESAGIKVPQEQDWEFPKIRRGGLNRRVRPASDGRQTTKCRPTALGNRRNQSVAPRGRLAQRGRWVTVGSGSARVDTGVRTLAPIPSPQTRRSHFGAMMW
ncbi:uncharacterized protein LOC144198995 [Stigmatopora nigra]